MLTPRQDLLLAKVIDGFASTGEPVASKALAGDPEVVAGSSTVRNELAVLEELQHPDGKEYTVQYFERAVFEMHPENRRPMMCCFRLLGAIFYKQRYPNGAPSYPRLLTRWRAAPFPETGKVRRSSTTGTPTAAWPSRVSPSRTS